MSRSKAPIAFGALAAGGIGYYLYSAGGDPKAAQHKAEGMFFSFPFVTISFRELPSRDNDSRKKGEG